MAAEAAADASKANNTKTNRSSLLLKEDWWAVWIGLGVVILALVLYVAGGSLSGIIVKFKGYESFAQVPGIFMPQVPKILGLYLAMAVIFSIAIGIMGRDVKKFLLGFTVLFIMAILTQLLAGWSVAKTLNLEAPVMALIVGMIIGNFVKIPEWFDAGMRTEFYVKTGIVLFGATLPFTTILKSGPVAFLQATAVAVSTFVVIYFVASKAFGLEKPFAATLGAGGSICGVSASIAIGSSVNAKKDHVSIAISMVVIWATIMVFLLPVVCRACGFSDGVSGALIGTSEFADAAGIAAAAQFGDGGIATFSLMKVVGRDIFVGVWALVMAIISVTFWEAKKEDGTRQKPGAGVIWERFPKFVLGFFIASILVTIVIMMSSDPVAAGINKEVLGWVKNLRGWCFVLCFLCIGLTTRFKDLAAVGWKPFAAFSIGVAVNVALGFLLSTVLLNDYWTAVGAGAVA